MDLEAIFIYCLCADTFNALNLKEDQQAKMHCAEIATFVIISALYYQCNYRKTRLVVLSHKQFPNILSHSRIVRRIHQIPSHVWPMIFQICKETLKVKNGQEFIVDSFPVPCCQNNKIFRCKILKGKEYRGYTASKKTYFFGIKVHMITTVQGIPVEFVFTPGSESDVRGLRRFECDLREGSILYADKAYTDYIQEDLLQPRVAT